MHSASHCWINGQSTKGEAKLYFEDYNPIDGSVYAEVEKGTVEHIDKAVRAAHQSFLNNKNCTVNQRESWLLKAAELLEQQSEEFVEILIDEIGSPITKATNEVKQSIFMLRAAAGSCRQVSGKTMPSDTPGRFSLSIREPVGVIAAITPFNVPLSKGIRLSAGPIALGNSVVALPSEESPVIACRLAKLYDDAGVPAGLFNVVTGLGHEIGDSLTSHSLVKVVTFTGSCVVGKHIQAICAKENKKVTLELGGKSPMVIMQDADLDKAVNAAIQSIFTFQGQICMAASRIYIEKNIFDLFCEKFIQAANEVNMGDLRDPKTMVGPVISKRQKRRIDGHIADALKKGASVAAGGEWVENRCKPTVLLNVTPEMDIYADETFGPVTSIYPVDSLDEAIKLSNDSVFGLSAAIFTSNLETSMRYAKSIKSGMVHINAGTIYSEPHVPFGGVGDSGFGREGTEVDIDLMTEWKWITIQS